MPGLSPASCPLRLVTGGEGSVTGCRLEPGEASDIALGLSISSDKRFTESGTIGIGRGGPSRDHGNEGLFPRGNVRRPVVGARVSTIGGGSWPDPQSP
jgi:hypothetical protein